MRKAVDVILAVLGCAISSLVVGLVLAGLGASGVVTMQITQALFWLAFGISVVAAPLATWLIYPSLKHVVGAFVVIAVIVGGGLWWLDKWLTLKKAEQDALNHPPPPILTSAPRPSVPMAKTPKPKPMPVPQVTIEQHGQGNGGVGGSITTAPCSNVQVGGVGNQATVNCAPPSHWYGLNGFEHSQVGSEINGTMGNEFNAYTNMENLRHAKEWESSRDAAEKQIVATPEWPTPYLEASIAHAALCQKEQ